MLVRGIARILARRLGQVTRNAPVRATSPISAGPPRSPNFARVLDLVDDDAAVGTREQARPYRRDHLVVLNRNNPRKRRRLWPACAGERTENALGDQQSQSSPLVQASRLPGKPRRDGRPRECGAAGAACRARCSATPAPCSSTRPRPSGCDWPGGSARNTLHIGLAGRHASC
jgi:hypothetical protein